ncbi:hypothetical protein AB1N83_009393 [Pleurotus pulmonarius]
MGATQSYIPAEAALTTVAVAGAIAFGYVQVKSQPPSSTAADSAGSKAGSDSTKKSKKKKRSEAPKPGDQVEDKSGAQSSATPAVVAFSEAIPGQFDAGRLEKQPTTTEPLSSKTKKKASRKNKKGKAKTALDSSVSGIVSRTSDTRSIASSEDSDANLGHSLSRTPQPAAAPSPGASQSRQLSRPHKQSTTSIDTDGSWTRVETRRGKRRHAPENVNTSIPAGDPSDAGVTTSVTTGNSSPVAERAMEEDEDEDEGEPFLASIAREPPQENRRTLAEKLLPKPRKTGVDDMTETPDYPQIARVIRVQPRPDEKPASGFSWGDYEDVHVDTSGAAENDADGEDDGWGVVRRSRPKRAAGETATVHQSASQKAPESMTKRQRQNASRREAEKAAQAEVEADRLARLAKHKSELERARMKEQFAGRK